MTEDDSDHSDSEDGDSGEGGEDGDGGEGVEEEEKKSRIDDLWSSFKQDTGFTSRSAKPHPPPGTEGKVRPWTIYSKAFWSYSLHTPHWKVP